MKLLVGSALFLGLVSLCCAASVRHDRHPTIINDEDAVEEMAPAIGTSDEGKTGGRV